MVSGWDPRPWRELRASYVFPTQEQWRREVELMMQDLEEFPSMGFPLSDNTRQAAFSIYAWNEFGEGGIMAPSQGWNTSKLSILADVVRNHSSQFAEKGPIQLQRSIDEAVASGRSSVQLVYDYYNFNASTLFIRGAVNMVISPPAGREALLVFFPGFGISVLETTRPRPR